MNLGNQLRSFKYDSISRLLYEKIPEQSATMNDGTGTYWSTKYTYTDWGAVATKQDARGVITTYGYDTLHRLVSVSYNAVSGVTTAPTVTYSYDTNQSSTTKGLLLSLTVGTSYSETFSYDSFKRAQSVSRTIDGRSYTSSYQFDTANQVTQMTYPSNRVINIGHDSKGRLASVGSYLSSVTYDGVGRLAGTTLGNGVTEGYGYDSNRMQLTSQTATKSGGPANGLMNLTYGYNATAGQMGAGSTAGNAGQLMSISGTINQTTESATYTYDNLGRLVTSNQTSNGSSAQRRFAYDRWGNRTGMWDAVSGGTQIQSITLQQSGGAPTNQIASVTSGSTVNYTYDAAGNVTNDGVHTYGYDSENRIVSVDGGATASYAYDNQNRRYKKTIGSTVTIYVWQGSQVIAEHNGSTGAVLIDYVHSGSRMVAKVSGGTTQYFLSDRLSTRLVLDTGGNVIGRQGHLPFGEDFGESGTQEKHHFTSYERDGEAGTDYAINRQYSQSVGRFVQTDPVDGPVDVAQGLNRYGYVRNRVLDNVDPLGLLERAPPAPCGGLTPGECLCRYFPEFCQPSGRPPKDRGDDPGSGEREKKPASLSIVSIIVLATGHTGDFGCIPGQDYGIKISIRYQVLDQDGKPMKVKDMRPQERVTRTVYNGQSQGDPVPDWTDIGPSRISGTSQGTDENGQFLDAPFGSCSSEPFTYMFKQEISILWKGKRYPVRVNKITVSSAGSGHGLIVNGSDINTQR